jgi:hypothetical protein
MASSGASRSRLLTAGGILSIIVGIYQIIVGLVLVGIMHGSLPFPAFLRTYFPFIYWQVEIGLILSALTGIRIGDWGYAYMDGFSGTRPVLLILICNVVLGIVAVVGGISAIKRKWFGVSLAGAVGAVFTVPLGILAVIFVALGKREFRKESLSSI